MHPAPSVPPGEAAILARITGAVIPDREFRRLRADATNARPALQAAIEACSAAGGGGVVLEGGRHHCRGPLVLRSGVELHLADEAVVTFDPKPEYYLPAVPFRWAGTDCYNYSPLIYAWGQTNIALTGRGTFDGNGEPWWAWRADERASAAAVAELRRLGEENAPLEQRVFGRPGALRPPLFSPHHCRNITVDGPEFRNSPFWTFCPTYCENVVGRNLRMFGEGCNSDAITADSCTDVLYEKVRIEVTDDGFVLKSGYNADGRRAARPCRNVVIRDSELVRGHTLVAFGSETAAGIENVFVHDCHASSDAVIWGIYLKSCPGRGGGIARVDLRRLSFQHVLVNLLRVNLGYAQNGPLGGELPVVDDVLVEDVTCAGAGKQPLFLCGNPEAPIGRVTLRHIRVDRAGASSLFAHAADLHLQDVQLAPAEDAAALAANDFSNPAAPPAGRWTDELMRASVA